MIGFAKPGSPEQVAICQYVAARLDNSGWPPETTAGMVKIVDDRMVGAVVFHDWQPKAGVMCMSSAGERGWLDNRTIYQMHSYVFDQCECQLAVLQVSEFNDLMRRTAEHFGYQGVRVPRLRGRDEDEILYTLTEEAWRAHPLTKRAIIKGKGPDPVTARENTRKAGTHGQTFSPDTT